MLWWSPVERGVLPLDGLRVSRSLRQSVRRIEVRVDTAFDEVIRACADPAREGAWIDEQVRAAYTRLHELGWAHSVEAWRDGELVGGLYGVAVGGLFAGESMFHRATDASKVALVALVDLLRDEHADRRVLDVQWPTEHLASLGVVTVAASDVPGDAGGRAGTSRCPAPSRLTRASRRVEPGCRAGSTRASDHLRGGARLADHRPAGGLPVEHAAVEVHDVVALLLEVHHRLRGAAADLAHHQRLALGHVGQPARQVAQRDVQARRRCGRAATRRPRGRRARAGPRGAGRGRR